MQGASEQWEVWGAPNPRFLRSTPAQYPFLARGRRYILILVKSFGKDESSPVCPHCVKAAAFERRVGMPRSRHQNSLDLGCTYQERDSIQSGSFGWPSEVEVRDRLLVPGQRTRTLQELIPPLLDQRCKERAPRPGPISPGGIWCPERSPSCSRG